MSILKLCENLLVIRVMCDLNLKNLVFFILFERV